MSPPGELTTPTSIRRWLVAVGVGVGISVAVPLAISRPVESGPMAVGLLLGCVGAGAIVGARTPKAWAVAAAAVLLSEFMLVIVGLMGIALLLTGFQ